MLKATWACSLPDWVVILTTGAFFSKLCGITKGAYLTKADNMYSKLLPLAEYYNKIPYCPLPICCFGKMCLLLFFRATSFTIEL